MVTSKLRKHKTNVALFSSQMIDSSKSLKVSLKPILQSFCPKFFRSSLLDLYESKGLYHEQFCLSLSKPGLVSFFSSEPSPWPGPVSALLMGTCGRRQKITWTWSILAQSPAQTAEVRTRLFALIMSWTHHMWCHWRKKHEHGLDSRALVLSSS